MPDDQLDWVVPKFYFECIVLPIHCILSLLCLKLHC